MRRLRIIAAIVVVLALGLAAAAWQVPQHLDWGRSRSAIAAIASARLGRPVGIEGEITLRLLPDVVLTASRVTLADRGDGMSASISALRLKLGLAPLLHGRIQPTDLVLDQPDLRLPWPLPQGIITPSATTDTSPEAGRLPRGFSARLEGGTLHLGSVTISGIAASLRADADTGALAANGVVTRQGRQWRTTALLGAPGSDGVSALNIAVDGQGETQGTGGFFRGRVLPSGALSGAVAARGPDLSRLMSAPVTPWYVAGQLTASGLRAQAPALDVSIGASPGHAALTLSLQQPFGLSGSLALSQADIGGWAAALADTAEFPVPLHLAVSATAGTLAGGILRHVGAQLGLGSGQATLTGVTATLPGGGTVALDGKLDPISGSTGFEGLGSLAIPDVHALLRGLGPVPPGLLPNLAQAAPDQARLSGHVTISRQGVTASSLIGTLDGAALSGTISLTRGAPPATRPRLTAGLSLDRIDLERWAFALPGLNTLASAPDMDVQLAAASSVWRGTALAHLDLDLQGGRNGLTLRHASAEVGAGAGAGHLTAAGTLGSDGSLTGARLTVASTDAAALHGLLPVRWQMFPALWQGGLDLTVTANGKPDAIATQLHADIGDARLEADGTLNLPARALDATVTLRHPGAPRLLQALGADHAADWIDTGSVALAAHLHAQPGLLAVHDFALSAAALRLGGSLQADLANDRVGIDAVLHADTLTLPRILPPLFQADHALPLAWLSQWDGRLQLGADTVLVGLTPEATGLQASAILAHGILAMDGAARHAGTSLEADMAIDAAAGHPAIALRATLTGFDLVAFGLTGAASPVALGAGTLDLQADLLAAGQSWPALRATASGRVHAALHDASLLGLDLGAVTRVLTAPTAKPPAARTAKSAPRATRPVPALQTALQVALGTGATTLLQGSADLTLDQGNAIIDRALLTGPDGTITVTGSADLVDRTEDLRLIVRPATATPPELGIRLVGPWATARRITDVAPALLWAGKPRNPQGSASGNGP